MLVIIFTKFNMHAYLQALMLLEIQSILVMLIGDVCFEAVRCLLLRYYAFYPMIAFD